MSLASSKAQTSCLRLCSRVNLHDETSPSLQSFTPTMSIASTVVVIVCRKCKNELRSRSGPSMMPTFMTIISNAAEIFMAFTMNCQRLALGLQPSCCSASIHAVRSVKMVVASWPDLHHPCCHFFHRCRCCSKQTGFQNTESRLASNPCNGTRQQSKPTTMLATKLRYHDPCPGMKWFCFDQMRLVCGDKSISVFSVHNVRQEINSE